MSTPTPEASGEPKLTRFEVIDPSGRVLVCNPCELHFSKQDGGRTLKVFLDRAPDFLAALPATQEPK